MKVPCSFCGLKTFLVLTVVSVILLILSLVLALKIIPDIIESLIDANVRLENGTEQFDRFEKLPFPLNFKVYIFNVENPDEVLNNGAKPILREIGPYVYKENRSKTIESFDEEEDTISYREKQVFYFDKEESGDLSEDDIVTVLNPAMLSMIQLSEGLGPIVSGLVAPCVRTAFPDHPTLIIDIPVKTIAFEGMNFCNIPQGSCTIAGGIACAIAGTKRNVDKLEGSLNFSYFNYKAKSDDGLYKVKRGIDDVTTLGQIMEIDGSRYTKYWADARGEEGEEGEEDPKLSCDEIKGCDSTIYPPHVTTNDTFYVYSTDICRYIEIAYKGEGSYKGIDGYRFGIVPETFRPTTEDPTEDCFCVQMTNNVDGEKTCFLDGVLDIQPCVGVPVVLSLPHFLWADSKYLEGVEGLNPVPEKHETFVLIEPNTGTPLQGFKRVQMNMVLRPVPGFDITDNLPRTVLPMFWLEEGIQLTDKYIDQLNDEYFNKKNAADIGQWVFVGVSALLTLIFGGLLIKAQFFTK